MYNNTYLSEYDNVLKNYFQDIRKYNNSFTKDEELKLLKLVKRGDTIAMHQLVMSNLKFVVKIAKNYQNQGLPLKDLINEGNLGLIKGAIKFNLKHNVRFITCAVWWIRQSILESIYENRSTVRETLNNITDKRLMNREKEKYYLMNGVEPYDGQILENGLEYRELDSVVVNSMNVKYDEFNDNNSEIIDTIKGDSFEYLEKEIDNIYINNEKVKINELLETLNEQEKEVIIDKYGLNNNGVELDLTLIAKKNKVSVERVRQIERIAIRKMRSIMCELEYQ